MLVVLRSRGEGLAILTLVHGYAIEEGTEQKKYGEEGKDCGVMGSADGSFRSAVLTHCVKERGRGLSVRVE